MGRKRREVGPTLLGVASTDPFYGTTSAARGAMYITHLGQSPVLRGCEQRRIIAGSELRYAEHTFDLRFPVDARVIRVLRKYQTGYGGDAIRHNPVTTIIYEDYYDEHHTVGCINVPGHLSLHQDFGFRYVKRPEVWDRLAPKEMFEKDTVIAASPAVKMDGSYGMGVNANVAFLSMPGTIEDGFVMSESFLKRASPTIFNKVTANAGRKSFFLNLYGDDKVYKPFPDVGDRIRDDGIIFASRDIDDNLSPADMTPRALRTVDRTFDRVVTGRPGALVVDIDVYHDNRVTPSATPTGMDRQMRKYYEANCNYYREILNEYKRMSRRPGGLRVTPEFNQLVFEAQVYLPVPENERKLTRMYRLEQLDEWRVEVTYEADLDPNMGYKYTDFHGGKGVVCKVEKDENMPIDHNGNRADVVIYGGSTIRRMNFGRMYEQFFNAASRDLTQKLRTMVGMNPHLKPTQFQIEQAVANVEFVETAWATLMRYYEMIAPLQYDMLINDPNRARHVASVLEDGIYLYMPVDNPTDLFESTVALRNSEFCPHIGPVSYVDASGRRVTTVANVLIGELSIMMLEKIGEDWSGVASTKTQQHGLPAKMNNTDKRSSLGREQPVRSMGESETRSYICTVGPWATMELLDQTTNPATHRHVVENILKVQQPTNIRKVVDRKKVPYGSSRPVDLYQHLFECRGIRVTYRPD